MNIIDGKKLAAEIRARVHDEVARLPSKPGLAVILVGADPASHLYVELKERACAAANIHFEKFLFFATEPEEKIIDTIAALNVRPDIHAILVQLPLPSGYDEDRIIQAIRPDKDVDGFHPENLTRLGQKNQLAPGLSVGIIRLAEAPGIPLAGKKAAIFANSEIFARPLRFLCEQRGMTITDYAATADLIITALGRPMWLTAAMTRDNAIIVDVGTTHINGRVAGDADFESFRNTNVWITPVPGGVGPMTVAMLLENTVALYHAQYGHAQGSSA